MRINDWNSDVCSSDLIATEQAGRSRGLGFRLHDRRREIIGERLPLRLVRRAEQPHQEEEGHHRGDEVGIGDLPRAALMAAMRLLAPLLDDGRARLPDEARVEKEWVSTCRARWPRDHNAKQTEKNQ